MSNTGRASDGTIVFAVVIACVTLILWLLQISILSDLGRSDAAGNAIAQAYAAIAVLAVWALLAVLMIIATVAAGIAIALPALLLIPASGFAAMAALDLLATRHLPPFLWPLVVPALVPPLVVGLCFWALMPALRVRINAGLAGGFVWGSILLLCIAIVPMQKVRGDLLGREAARIEKAVADYANLPADAPLWEVTPFLATRNSSVEQAVLDRIRHLDRRQSDAELMLERGDFPLRHLGRIDLDPTPSICEKARAQLRRSVGPLVLVKPNSRPFVDIAEPVADAVAAMRWLVGYGCSCDAESQAWQSMVEGYRDPGYDVVELRQLRDPKELGRILREYPERFSMLTPQAHLKAWLKFAGVKETREQALAGARKLDHRTADAVEMLRDNEHVAWEVMSNLFDLDLEATPGLCAGALKSLQADFNRVYRPRPDDPRPYRELLNRLGQGYHFDVLVWLAEHGCNTDAQSNDAIAIISAYQESPQRAAMLAKLTRLRH